MPEAMIVTAQPEASEAGARVLKAGGNAIDAAMAAALVQGVVDPQMCGIAGFGNCQIFMPGKGVHTCLDFHGKTPLAATSDMWHNLLIEETRDGFGFVLKDNVNDLGYGSITTPGNLMAYYEAVRDFGTWDWSDIVAPSIAHADRGFAVRPHVYFWWTHGAALGRVQVDERLAFSKTGARVFFTDDGRGGRRLKRIGERVENPDMAETLRKIQRDGIDTFYRGEIADMIDADMRANGGLMRKADLEAYKVGRSDPIETTYRGLRVASNHPPGGGVMLLEMLNILEHFDLAGLGHNSADYIRTVCEAMKRATADKEAFVGDPAFVDVPLGRLTGKEYAAECATKIQRGERAHVERVTSESPQTTHVAVVDKDGNCVTMTHSLGMPSGVITDGLGFMYNGAMAVFDPRPGRAGSVAPGKSRFSSLCPTIVFEGERPKIVIGAPGGTQIAMGVLQTLLNVIDHKMPIDRAVSVPRFSSTSNAIDITNRIPDYAVEPLRKEGYELIRSALTFHIAAVHGITIGADGRMEGGADPGHDGVALPV